MKLNDIRDMSKDDILAVLGLSTRRSAGQKFVGSMSMFAVGLLVGAAAALLLAPKTGQDLRDDLGQRLRDLRENARNGAGELDNGSPSAPSSASSRDNIRT